MGEAAFSDTGSIRCQGELAGYATGLDHGPFELWNKGGTDWEGKPWRTSLERRRMTSGSSEDADLWLPRWI